MTGAVSDIAFTPAVKAEQAKRGSRAAYARMAEKGDWSDTVDDRLAGFIAELEAEIATLPNHAGGGAGHHRPVTFPS